MIALWGGNSREMGNALISTLCSFKHHYDANTPLAQVMPELVRDLSPGAYAEHGYSLTGDKMFCWLRMKIFLR
ncbi:hypothetical protein KCP75_22735 [Salmonella enterica subsp. enterica]|nr:hypothetical protein KCP75_22735 [Salmonella enterica subsp. enterica]